MGSADRWRSRLRHAFGSWHTLRWPAAVGAWLVVGLIMLSGLASAADPGSRHLRATREVSGTVTLVNYNAAKFCLDTDVTGEQFCSVSYQRVGSAPLVVGEQVTGTVALLSTGPSGAMEVFILTDPLPSP
jgi:hypothetical protein